MTVTLIITTGLKWSITLSIFGSILVKVADVFKEQKPLTCLAAAITGLGLCVASIWLFLVWLWSI